VSVEDEGWVEAVMSTMKLPDVSNVILPGSLWVSRETGRRGKVRWSTPTQTMFEFREGLDASRLYETDSFLRLFKEV
jgi:hypothetical protein